MQIIVLHNQAESKDLVSVMGINTNTVLRALRLLRDEGLLEFRRGRGITVAVTPEKGAEMAKLNELLVFARSQGYRSEESIAMMRGCTNMPWLPAPFENSRLTSRTPSADVGSCRGAG